MAADKCPPLCMRCDCLSTDYLSSFFLRTSRCTTWRHYPPPSPSPPFPPARPSGGNEKVEDKDRKENYDVMLQGLFVGDVGGSGAKGEKKRACTCARNPRKHILARTTIVLCALRDSGHGCTLVHSMYMKRSVRATCTKRNRKKTQRYETYEACSGRNGKPQIRATTTAEWRR